jgi:hypothetical protein
MRVDRRDTIESMRARTSASRDRSRAVRCASFARTALLALTVVVATGRSRAEGKSAFLSEQLRKNPDFRVRTTAALSLGTSDDTEAVKPLCACLDDDAEVESVRVACAAALGKVAKPGSDVCLRGHASDASAKVKEQVASSLKAIGGSIVAASQPGCPPATPAATSKPKYYVGLVVTNKSARDDGDLRPMLTRELRCKLAAAGRFRLAPDDAVDAKSMMSTSSKEKLEGVLLSLQVDAITYEGGSLKVSLKLTLMTAGRDLKGEISKVLEMPGVSKPSKGDEDELLKRGAQRLAAAFVEMKP